VLCGRNAVQVVPDKKQKFSLPEVAEKLRGLGPLVANPYLVRVQVEGYELTVFDDGRAIIKGTDDVQAARTLYAKYIGA